MTMNSVVDWLADMLEGFRNGTFVVDADHAISMMVTPNYTAVRAFVRAPEGAKESTKQVRGGR